MILPVDQAFTCEAGRSIWGFPKVMADFTVRDGDRFGFDVAADGRHIAGMEFGRGLPLPGPLISIPRTLTAYSHLDGVTREIPWRMRVSGLRVRASGVALRLGTHPYARELAALGLPKRALASASAARVQMAFDDAGPVGPALSW